MLEPFLSELNKLRIVLASGSEQRANLLKATVRDVALYIPNIESNIFQNLKFKIIPSTFEENLDWKKHTFSDFVEQTALGKAQEVWQRLNDAQEPADIVIGVDTMVAHNGRLYGKPQNKKDAFRIISE